jgi:hypothetical protein
MKRFRMAVLAVAVLGLAAACAAPPAARPPPAPTGACNAAGARFAAGRPLTPQLEQEARVRSGAAMVRILRPGQVVTLEYNEQRLNIEIDASGRVIRIRCG